jgi:hypothetical protein
MIGVSKVATPFFLFYLAGVLEFPLDTLLIGLILTGNNATEISLKTGKESGLFPVLDGLEKGDGL